MSSRSKSEWLIPAGLLALSAIPLVMGGVRLTELARGGAITPENARFFAAPLPVVLHIVAAGIFCAAGAFQFPRGFRRRRTGWHRGAGQLLIPCGLVAAATGLWMTHFYELPPLDGELLYGTRLLFGWAMVLSLILGALAIRRRDFVAHGAWMLRAYAIGQGAGTQVLTHLPWFLLVGMPSELSRAALMAAGWGINLAVAEWVIRRRPAAIVRPLAPVPDAEPARVGVGAEALSVASGAGVAPVRPAAPTAREV